MASPAEVCEPVVEAAGESESALALAQKENMGLQDKIIMLEEEAVLKATEQKEELELLHKSARINREKFELLLEQKQNSLDESNEQIQRLKDQRDEEIQESNNKYQKIKHSLSRHVQLGVAQAKELRELRNPSPNANEEFARLHSQIESELAKSGNNFELWSAQAGRVYVKLEQLLEKTKEENATLKKRCSDLVVDKNDMISQLAQAANDITVYDSKIDDGEKRLKELKSKESKQAKHLGEALEKNKRMKDALAAANSQAKETEKTHAKEKHDLEARLVTTGSANGFLDLQHDLTVARNQVKALKEKATAADTDVDLANQKMEAVARDAAKYASAKKEATAAKRMVADANKKVAERDSKIQAAKTEVTAAKKRVEDAEKEVEAAVERATAAEKEATTAKQMTAQARKEVTTRDSRIATVVKELATAKAQAETAVMKVTAAEKEVAMARKKTTEAVNESAAEKLKVVNLEKQVAAAREQTASAIEEATTAKKEVVTFKERAENAEREADDAKKQAAAAAMEVDTMKIKAIVMQNRAEAAEREVAKDVDRIQVEVDRVQVEAIANDTIKHLKEQLADALNRLHFHSFPAQITDSALSEGQSIGPAHQHFLPGRHSGRLRSASDCLHGDNDPRKDNRIAELVAKNIELMDNSAEGGAHSPEIYPFDLRQIKLLKEDLSKAVNEGWNLQTKNHELQKKIKNLEEQATMAAAAPPPPPPSPN